MNEQNLDLTPGEASQKRVWQTPIMEEIDVAATESNPYVGGNIDLALYTN